MQDYREYVEKHRQRILDSLNYIWTHPETGYKEWKTHAYLAEQFSELGYELKEAGNIPGFTVEIDTGKQGPTIGVFGELDALICNTHPDADPVTGAVHSCGHCAQVAALLGLAAALKEPGALNGLCGKIRLIAVPAEELIEVEFREELRKKGVIRYFGGKPEFMYRGLLDGVDMALMIHTSVGEPSCGKMNGGSNGCIAKRISFQGVAAHAGSSPHLGVNALYAANLAMNAINALRETFQDSAHVRVHPIITNGGDAVNAIPESVTLESYIRAATVEDMTQVNQKMNRAIAASAAALGAKVHLRDIPGYFPRRYPESGYALVKEAMEQVLDRVEIDANTWGGGCSDIGDVGTVMPILHPMITGASGKGHGNDYQITDPDTACVKSAVVQLTLLAMLLQEDGKKAEQLITEYEPNFQSMDEYFAFADNLNLDCDAVQYEENGSIHLNFV